MIGGAVTGRRHTTAHAPVAGRLKTPRCARRQSATMDMTASRFCRRKRDAGSAACRSRTRVTCSSTWKATPSIREGWSIYWAFVTGTADKAVFKPFWAHDRAEEKRAFEQAVDFIVERLEMHPAAHVYHYAAYEASALILPGIARSSATSQVPSYLAPPLADHHKGCPDSGMRSPCLPRLARSQRLARKALQQRQRTSCSRTLEKSSL